jgi:hypothetical protein
MATTTKGGRGKTTVGAKTRSNSKIKLRRGSQAKIGKPASKPRTQKVKAGADGDASKRKSMKRTARLAPSGGGVVATLHISTRLSACPTGGPSG